MKKHDLSDILIFVLSAELVGALSALLSGGYSGFYDKFAPPPLLPPAWLFPVVWTILYALMGFSAYLVYSSGDDPDRIKRALTIYWVQLAVNFSWSIVYFRFEALWAGFAVILLMIILTAAMIRSFARIRKTAGILNIPYILWLCFAAYLNLATALINT